MQVSSSAMGLEGCKASILYCHGVGEVDLRGLMSIIAHNDFLEIKKFKTKTVFKVDFLFLKVIFCLPAQIKEYL